MTDQPSAARLPVSSSPAAVRRRPGALFTSLVFAWRSMLKIRHVPEQMGDVLMIPVMFTLLFTYLFGGALSGSTGAYLQYLLPGTLAMTVLLVTMYTGMGLNTDITSGAFDRFRSLPMWRPAPLVGALLGDTARYLVAAGLVIGLGLLMGYRPGGGAPGTIAAVVLVLAFAFALSWIWLTLGLVLRTAQSVSIAGLVILFPVTFVSNVFVDPTTMPSWLRTIVEVNPVSHLVTSARDLMGGMPVGNEVWIVLAACGVLVAVFGPLTVYLYQSRS
jgi:daunorubicin/doxorubicin transport system permease protein